LIQLIAKLAGTYFYWHNQVVFFSPALRGGSFLRDLLLVLLLRMGGTTLVFHIHGRDIAELHHSKLYRLLHGLFFKRDYVICLAETLASDVLPYVERERLFIVPNGIPDPYAAARVEQAVQARRERSVPHILYLSTMMVAKGLLVLLNALAILKERGVSFSACLAGAFYSDPSEEQFLSAVQKLNLGDDVKWIGPVYEREKEELFLASDIFVLPTLRETFPVVSLEAMAAALPIVASAEGALTEIVDHNATGFLCPKGDERKVADYLQILCEDSRMRADFGAKGREKFSENYTDHVFRRNMVNTFQSLLQRMDKG